MPNRQQFKTKKAYNEYFRIYREKNRERLRDYNKEYNRLWRHEHGFENEKKWRHKNRLKVNVERILYRAIKRGDIKRLPCIICGKKKGLAHHPDYSKPLEVIFLCALHHKEIHKKSKSG